MALTEKQRRFVAEYLVDLNATQAAIRAGYSEKTAGQIGEQNLKKLEIQEALQKAMKDRERRTEITQDAVLKELAKVAFANGSDFASVVVREVPEDVWDEEEGIYRKVARLQQMVQLKNTEDIPEYKRAAISGIKEGKHGIEVSSYDKVRALELLGKHLGMFDGKGGQTAGNENNLLDVIKGAPEVSVDEIPEAE